MSLQIWLPLNGNGNNQGLDATPTVGLASDASYVTGKTGAKALVANKLGTETTFSSLSGAQQFSIAYWLKLDTSLSFGNYVYMWMLQYKTAGNSVHYCRHEMRNTSGSYQIIINKDANVGSGNFNANSYHAFYYETSSGGIHSCNNEWHHFVIVKDLDTLVLYVDGEKRVSISCSLFETGPGSLTGKLRIANGATQGCLNDFRVYDHCLSQKEAQELAKGLVLHYRLAGPGQENLIKASGPKEDGWGINQSGGTFTKTITAEGTSFEVTTQATSWFLYYHNFSNLSTAGLKPNTEYTYSFECKSNQSFNLDIKILKGNGTIPLTNNKAVRIEGDNEWHKYKVTLTTNSTLDISDQYFYMTGGNLISKTQFRYAKLEEGTIATPWTPHPSDTLWTTMGYSNNIEYDCSGFENNGTKSGQLTWNVDSPRYATSYKIGLTKAYVDTPNIIFEQMPQGTLNMWINRHSSTSDWRQYACFANSYNWTSTEQDFIIIGSTGGIQITLDCCSNTYSYTPTLNEWHMYTITWDLQQHTSSVYIDGEFIHTVTSPRIDTLYASKHNYHAFGNRLSSDVNDYSMSDARIYSTVLSAEAVAELYHSAVIIDNTGKTYAYEYFEG